MIINVFTIIFLTSILFFVELRFNFCKVLFKYFIQLLSSTSVFPMAQVVPFCSHEAIVDRRRKQRMALHSCKALVTAVEKVAAGRWSLYPFTVSHQLYFLIILKKGGSRGEG